MSTATKFYNFFWSSEQCQNIFLLHKEQLLEKKEIELNSTKKAYYLQRFVLSNSLKKRKTAERIEQRIQNRNIDTDHTLNILATRNLDEEKIKRYFKQKFGEPLELISKTLDGNRLSQMKFFSELTSAFLSEARLIQFLKKYKLIAQDLNSLKEVGSHFEKLAQSEFTAIINSDHFVDLFETADGLARYYDNYNFTNLIDADKFYTDVFYDNENFKNRLDLFDSLFEQGVLLGGHYKAYYECVECAINTFFGAMSLNVTPGKIKLKCPNCNKEAFYIVPYKIDEAIFNDIKSKDGLLFHAVKNLLTSKQIIHQPNISLLNDIELDFQILNKSNLITHIIEIKMFKTDRPKDTTASNLRDGFRKFLNARNKLVEHNSGYKNVSFIFLTNILNDTFLNELRESFSAEIINQQIFVISIKGFLDFSSQLAKTYKQ